jgi:hypothetical protein
MLLVFHGYHQKKFCIKQTKPGKIDGTISPGLTGRIFYNLLYIGFRSMFKNSRSYPERL